MISLRLNGKLAFSMFGWFSLYPLHVLHLIAGTAATDQRTHDFLVGSQVGRPMECLPFEFRNEGTGARFSGLLIPPKGAHLLLAVHGNPGNWLVG